MANNKPFRFGPVAVANAVGNLLNPGTTTGGVNCTGAPYDKLRLLITHIRIVNKTAGAVTFSGYIGATGGSAAGTEFLGTGLSIPANSYVDWYGRLPLDTTDFLTGVASASTSLTIEGEGEISVNA